MTENESLKKINEMLGTIQTEKSSDDISEYLTQEAQVNLEYQTALNGWILQQKNKGWTNRRIRRKLKKENLI